GTVHPLVSLHGALPIWTLERPGATGAAGSSGVPVPGQGWLTRESTVGAPGIEPDVEVVPHRDVTSRHHREGEGRILVFPEPRLRRVVPRLHGALSDCLNGRRARQQMGRV